jgi:hypothetical protein
VQRPLGRREESCPDKLSDFISEEGGEWNEEMVKQHFFDLDVADILRTPVGKPNSHDFVAWNHTKNGIFSVKSAYHLAVQRKRDRSGAAESSSSVEKHKGWLALWAAQVPGKIKVHMWRLIENGLAVGSELSHRKIKDGVVCLVCGRTESLIHRFWTCPHSAQAWALLAERVGHRWEPPPKTLVCHAELKGWILDWIGKVNDDQRAWAFNLIYNLWLARNDAREVQRIQDPGQIVQKVVAAVEEWRNRRRTASIYQSGGTMESSRSELGQGEH